MAMPRVWLARCGGAGAALLLGWLALWLAPRWALPLLGVLALARALASLSATWLAPALPRRLLPALGRRAVLVTGCDSGFGRLSALRLAGRGVRVVAGVLLPDGEGAQLLREQAQAQALPLSVVALDVTDQASLDAALRLVQRTLAEHSCELWAVVNNAGVFTFGETEWMQIEDVKRLLDVNTLGQIRVTQTFLPLLRKSRGRVVNINSVASRIAVTGLAPYTISKFASLGFTDSLRADLMKSSVSVHSVEPAIYMTPMSMNATSMMENTYKNIPKEIAKSYCDRYAEKMMKMKDFLFMATTKSKISDVTGVVEDACLSEDPLETYSPGEWSKIIYTFGNYVPGIQRLVLHLCYKYL